MALIFRELQAECCPRSLAGGAAETRSGWLGSWCVSRSHGQVKVFMQRHEERCKYPQSRRLGQSRINVSQASFWKET